MEKYDEKYFCQKISRTSQLRYRYAAKMVAETILTLKSYWVVITKTRLTTI
jgi:hypothetical protein